MKKIFILFAVVALATTWVGCSDDDDDSPKRKLISKIVNDNDGYEYRFTYNDDGSLKAFVEDDDEYMDSIVLERSGNKLVVRDFEFEDGELLNPEGTIELICTLDEYGRVKECMEGEDDTDPIYFTYSETGELIHVSYWISHSLEYEWAQGNIVSITEGRSYAGEYHTTQCFPSEIENNTNLDLEQFLFGNRGLNFGWLYWPKALTEYMGVRCKNFIDTYEEAWRWKYDENGDLVEICNYPHDNDPCRIIYMEQ